MNHIYSQRVTKYLEAQSDYKTPIISHGLDMFPIGIVLVVVLPIAAEILGVCHMTESEKNSVDIS